MKKHLCLGCDEDKPTFKIGDHVYHREGKGDASVCSNSEYEINRRKQNKNDRQL